MRSWIRPYDEWWSQGWRNKMQYRKFLGHLIPSSCLEWCMLRLRPPTSRNDKFAIIKSIDNILFLLLLQNIHNIIPCDIHFLRFHKKKNSPHFNFQKDKPQKLYSTPLVAWDTRRLLSLWSPKLLALSSNSRPFN